MGDTPIPCPECTIDPENSSLGTMGTNDSNSYSISLIGEGCDSPDSYSAFTEEQSIEADMDQTGNDYTLYITTEDHPGTYDIVVTFIFDGCPNVTKTYQITVSDE
jgi:hypothetical protein